VLRFEVTVIDVRPATESEIHEAEHAHGHAEPLVALGKKRPAEQPPS
jgi:FKBP-type peptidyl-prolyl cis-trans isomerase 2